MSAPAAVDYRAEWERSYSVAAGVLGDRLAEEWPGAGYAVARRDLIKSAPFPPILAGTRCRVVLEDSGDRRGVLAHATAPDGTTITVSAGAFDPESPS